MARTRIFLQVLPTGKLIKLVITFMISRSHTNVYPEASKLLYKTLREAQAVRVSSGAGQENCISYKYSLVDNQTVRKSLRLLLILLYNY